MSEINYRLKDFIPFRGWKNYSERNSMKTNLGVFIRKTILGLYNFSLLGILYIIILRIVEELLPITAQ